MPRWAPRCNFPWHLASSQTLPFSFLLLLALLAYTRCFRWWRKHTLRSRWVWCARWMVSPRWSNTTRSALRLLGCVGLMGACSTTQAISATISSPEASWIWSRGMWQQVGHPAQAESKNATAAGTVGSGKGLGRENSCVIINKTVPTTLTICEACLRPGSKAIFCGLAPLPMGAISALSLAWAALWLVALGVHGESLCPSQRWSLVLLLQPGIQK